MHLIAAAKINNQATDIMEFINNKILEKAIQFFLTMYQGAVRPTCKAWFTAQTFQ